jgi:hypothetical protein
MPLHDTRTTFDITVTYSKPERLKLPVIVTPEFAAPTAKTYATRSVGEIFHSGGGIETPTRDLLRIEEWWPLQGD